MAGAGIPFTIMTTSISQKRLFLLFESGGTPYAMDCGSVVEVVPRVALQAMDGAAGRLRYRGRWIPVVDLSTLVGGGSASADRLSTRIVVVRGADPGAAGNLLGLIVERAVRVARVEEADVSSSPEEAGAPACVEGRLTHEGQSVRRLAVSRLLPPALQDAFFRNPAGEG